MDHKVFALVVGGVLPAIMLGLAGIFQKLSTNGGIGTGPFLIGVGFTTVIVGSVFLLVEKQAAVSLQSGAFTVLFGLIWATATGFVAISLSRYGAQISQLVPLYKYEHVGGRHPRPGDLRRMALRGPVEATGRSGPDRRRRRVGLAGVTANAG